MKANGRSASLRFSARLKWTRPTSRQRLSRFCEKGLDRQAAFQKFVVERALERAPERGETLDVEIFAPAHRRRFVDEQDQLILGRFGNARRSACRGLAAGADRRDEANGEAPPEGEVRRETAARLGRAELQEAVPAAAVEGGRETAGDAVVERRTIPPAEVRGAARGGASVRGRRIGASGRSSGGNRAADLARPKPGVRPDSETLASNARTGANRTAFSGAACRAPRWRRRDARL